MAFVGAFTPYLAFASLVSILLMMMITAPANTALMCPICERGPFGNAGAQARHIKSHMNDSTRSRHTAAPTGRVTTASGHSPTSPGPASPAYSGTAYSGIPQSLLGSEPGISGNNATSSAGGEAAVCIESVSQAHARYSHDIDCMLASQLSGQAIALLIS